MGRIDEEQCFGEINKVDASEQTSRRRMQNVMRAFRQPVTGTCIRLCAVETPAADVAVG